MGTDHAPHVERLRKINTGRKMPDWHKEIISKRHKGSKLSKEHCEKIDR